MKRFKVIDIETYLFEFMIELHREIDVLNNKEKTNPEVKIQKAIVYGLLSEIYKIIKD